MVSADGILPGSSSKLQLLIINLASVPGGQLVNSPTAQSLERWLKYLRNISKFVITIYIRLLNEGTEVYRPVPSLQQGDNIYKVFGNDIYDPNDETWEFLPGSVVICEQRQLSGEICLVAKSLR